MNGFIDGSMLLVGVLALVKVSVWSLQAWTARQDRKQCREWVRHQLLSEAQALQAASRIKRNHRQFERALWDRR